MSRGPAPAVPSRPRPAARLAAVLVSVLAAGPVAAGPSTGSPVLAEPAREAVARLARDAAARQAEGHGAPVRLAVTVGEPDARLRLAACVRAEAHALPGAAAWGATRVGLRCAEGPVRWSIAVPVTVTAIGTAWVAASALPAGARLTPADLRSAEVDLAADRSPVVADAGQLVGRELQRAVDAGAALRQSHLRARQWFAAGDTVRLVARGDGFQVGGSGEALNPGVEGRPSRVRTEGGRILTVRPVGEREAEVLP